MTISFAAFADELCKLAAPAKAQLATNTPTQIAPNGDQAFGDETEPVKTGFAVSQYSGPLSYGRFKQESYIPPFSAPALKVSEKKASSALTPAGRLASTAGVGQPKMGAPPGPSIAQLTKPKGFGTPMPGATKELQSVPSA